MKHTIVAKRYAKALFAVGKTENKLDAFSQGLNTLAAIYAEVPVVLDALTNPLYPLDVRGKVMESLAGMVEADQLLKNFLNLLVQKKRAEALVDIAEKFQSLVDEDRRICRGTVVAATELSEELQTKVQSTLEKITGKKVILTSEVEPAIIGGMIAKVGDLVLDGSIRSQLASLNESIKGSE